MKTTRVFYALLIVIVSSMAAFAQKVGVPVTRCEVGLLYQISYQPNWGDSHAIVVEVLPDSPAALAGVKVGDIIETIDGISTQEMSEEEINASLLDPTRREVTIAVSNFGYRNKEIVLHKVCLPIDALSEAQLARSFQMYSLEDVTDRRFTMPFIYTVPVKRNFIDYKSFSFPADKRITNLEKSITQALQNKGLKYVERGGDLEIQVRVNMEQNPNYRAGAESDLEEGLRNYRLNTQTGDIQEYPFLSINAPAFTGTHRLTIDVKMIDTKDNTQIWSVTAKERLNQQYDADNYIRNFGSLMFANFPLVRYVMNPTYVLHKNNYRYIGIHLDARDLQRVLWVDKGSPADKAGLIAGDRIKAINGLPLHKSVDTMTEAYMSFVARTWDLRDPATIYPSSEGFQRNMYWKVDKYLQVAEMLQYPKLYGALSYLFSHRTYVHSPIIKDIVLDIDRGGKSEAIAVKPILKQLDYVEIL